MSAVAYIEQMYTEKVISCKEHRDVNQHNYTNCVYSANNWQWWWQSRKREH